MGTSDPKRALPQITHRNACKRCKGGLEPCRHSRWRGQYADPCNVDLKSWNNLGASAPG